MKFVQTPSEEVHQQLHEIYQHHACFKNRQRAHAILLSLASERTNLGDFLLSRSKCLNILGFMSRKNEFHFQALEGSVKTEQVIAAFDAFAARYYRFG